MKTCKACGQKFDKRRNSRGWKSESNEQYENRKFCSTSCAFGRSTVCNVKGCEEKRYRNYAICLYHRRERTRHERPADYNTPNASERSCLPAKPIGLCLIGACECPAYPADALCGYHRWYYSQSLNVSGRHGELKEEERRSQIALARLALELFPDEVVA